MKLPIPFSNPKTYKGHSGVDYGQPRGTPILASGPGKVTSRSKNAAGGYYIWVQYDGGPKVGYHHMDSHDGCPDKGARVSLGTRLGYVGNTGNSTGPHLHNEVSGHRTTAGYWKFFDPDRVVHSVILANAAAAGTKLPAGTPTKPATPAVLEDEMDMIHYTEKVVDVPGIAGVRHATWKDEYHYLVFSPTWYKKIVGAGTVANQHATAFNGGRNSRLVTKAEHDLVVTQIDSLPKGSGGPVTVTGPSKEDIAAEVIRQMKLPGN